LPAGGPAGDVNPHGYANYTKYTDRSVRFHCNNSVTISNVRKKDVMGKSDNDPFAVRRSFSHARVKPVVVEKLKRRPMGPVCPSCGAKMKLVLGVAEPTGKGKIAASCPRCAGVNVQPDSQGR
jgi:hypothetical protein